MAKKFGRGQAFEAELQTAMERVIAAVRRGWNRIYLETNSSYVVSIFRRNEVVLPWKFQARREWMMEFLQGTELNVNHIYREGNAVADAISKFKDFDRFICWDSPPSFILDLAERDRFTEYFRIF